MIANTIRTLGEVQSKSRLIRSKIVDVEDEFLRQVLLGPPDHPPYSGIDQPIFVSAHIDALHQGQPEVPFQLWVQKWCDEPTTCCIYMDWCVPSDYKNSCYTCIIITIALSHQSTGPVCSGFASKEFHLRALNMVYESKVYKHVDRLGRPNKIQAGD